jgi:hypothetical protein
MRIDSFMQFISYDGGLHEEITFAGYVVQAPAQNHPQKISPSFW